MWPKVSAQEFDINNATSTPITAAGHDYITLLNETVNPANGSVSLNLNIPTRPGRKLTVPFGIQYNSNRMHYQRASGSVSTAFLLPGWTQAGWAYTVPMLTMNGGYQPDECLPNQACECHYFNDYVFHDPNGGGHNLGLGITEHTGYSQCQGMAPGLTQSVLSGGDYAFSATTTDIPSSSPLYAPPVTVKGRDGTIYYFSNPTRGGGNFAVPSNVPDYVEDSNGNRVTYALGPNSGQSNPGPITITDTLGNKVLSTTGFNSTGAAVDVTGLDQPYVLTWGSQNVDYALNVQVEYSTPTFTCNATPASLSDSTPVLSSIELPNDKSYSFEYDPVYGNLAKVTYPSGGYVRYQWGSNPMSESAIGYWYTPVPVDPTKVECIFRYDVPAITDRWVSYDGSTEVLHQHFSYPAIQWSSSDPAAWTLKTTVVTTSDLVAGTQYTKTYKYVPDPFHHAEPFVANDGAGPIPLEQSVTVVDQSGSQVSADSEVWANEYLLSSKSTTLGSGTSAVTSSVAYNYDGNGQLIEKDDYDFGQSTITKKTLTSYQAFAGALGTIYDRPCKVTVAGGPQSGGAETDILYDGETSVCGASVAPSVSAVAGLPAGTHDDTNYGTGSHAPRGNPTAITKVNNTGSSMTTSFTYDVTGQMTSVIDPCGNAACVDVSGTAHTTQYVFTDPLTGGDPQGNSNAYLTQIKKPSTNGIAHQEEFAYDYESGNLTSHTDENSRSTTYQYNDPLLRLRDVYDPLSATNGQTPHTHYDYIDGVGASVTTTDPVGVKTEIVYDGMDHPIKSIKITDPQSADTVTATYDGIGLVASVTTPERSFPSLATDDLTTYVYDTLGRRTLQTKQSDHSTESWTYIGNTVTFKDEATHSWKRSYDAFGRLIQVLEPSTISGIAPETDYSYDALDNLIKVDQHGGSDGERVRTFTYDSLSRLVCAANPESSTTACPTSASGTMPQGTMHYAYDANGNVSSRIDARNAETDYTYDALNRVTTKTYPTVTTAPGAPPIAPTAAVNYIYDVAIGGWGWVAQTSPSWPSVSQTNLIGRLSDVAVGNPGANAWTVYGYDEMGRTVLKSECLPVDCGNNHHDLHYKYDLAGRMTFFDRGLDADNNSGQPNSGFYFGGFTMGYDGANNLSSVTGDTGGTNTATNIWSNTDYFPTGQVYTALALGRYNLKYSVSPRGWVTGQVITNTATQSIWNSSTSFNTNGTVSATTDSHAGAWSYTYDALNRIWKASGPGGSTTYTTDAFGNKKGATTTSGVAPSPNYGVYPTNALSGNALQYDLTTGSGSPAGAGYPTGNVISDGSGDSFRYDAEGRLYSVMNGTTCFTYDGDGDRVAMTNCNVVNHGNGTTTGILSEYLYDIDHRLMTEINPTTAQMTRANIYAGGLYLGEDAPDAYLTNTPTASLLRVTDTVGTLRARWDLGSNWDGACTSFPYGDGMACSVAPLSKALFTGKDRDSVSGLDYFGARYYASSMGRFMSPDPHAGQIDNPQSLNRYAYVLNDPLSNTDPTGMDCVYLNGAGTTVEIDNSGNQAIDTNSSKGECMGDATQKGTGGYWVDGTANTLYLDPNSNAVALIGYENGSYTQSPIYNADATVSVNASSPADISVEDISLYNQFRLTGPISVMFPDNYKKQGYSLWQIGKHLFNCWAEDNAEGRIGPSRETSRTTDTIPNKAADLRTQGHSRQYGHVTGPNLGNPEAAEMMGNAGDAAALITDLNGCASAP